MLEQQIKAVQTWFQPSPSQFIIQNHSAISRCTVNGTKKEGGLLGMFIRARKFPLTEGIIFIYLTDTSD